MSTSSPAENESPELKSENEKLLWRVAADDDGKSTTTSSPGIDTEQSSVRQLVGNTMHSFSDTVNDNLIAARFGVFASVLLLTAYGISNTPLFFRYRQVSELPASFFVNRKRLYGRIIGLDKSNEKYLQVYIRHLSPVGQILPKAWFDFFMKASPLAAQRLTAKPEEAKSELLKVQIAGVEYSPSFSQYNYKAEEFLERLAKDRTLVSCQLLARQVPILPNEKKSEKRQLNVVSEDKITIDKDDFEKHIALCKLSYRPTLLQLFSTDIGVSLILAGNAAVASSVISSGSSISAQGNDDNNNTEAEASTRIIDASPRVDDLRKDVEYLDQLTRAEFDALKNKQGIWAFSEIRETRKELVEEIEFQANANILQKILRRLRGG